MADLGLSRQIGDGSTTLFVIPIAIARKRRGSIGPAFAVTADTLATIFIVCKKPKTDETLPAPVLNAYPSISVQIEADNSRSVSN
jgi:hypothetical protein